MLHAVPFSPICRVLALALFLGLLGLLGPAHAQTTAGALTQALHSSGALGGLIMGLYISLLLVCLMAAGLNRSSHFVWLGLFVLLVLLSQFSLPGDAQRIWPAHSWQQQLMPWAMPLWALAVLIWLVMRMTQLDKQHMYLYAACVLMAAVCVGLPVVATLGSDALSSLPMAAVVDITLALLACTVAWVAWCSRAWLWWVLLALLPVSVAVGPRVTHAWQWLGPEPYATLARAMAGIFAILIIYAALIRLAREQHAAKEREEAVNTTDAKTGLIKQRVAQRRLPQLLARSRRQGEPCGVVMVRWLDVARRQSEMSGAGLSYAYAHLGSRLKRLGRDIDTVARFGDDCFLIQVEAPVTREALTSLGTHILSTCMRPSTTLGGKGFSVQVALWGGIEEDGSSTNIIEQLRTRLAQMGADTPRRMQFVDSQLSTHPGALSDSELSDFMRSQGMIEKINAIEATHPLPPVALKPRLPRDSSSAVVSMPPIMGVLQG